jgi:glutathione synthase/RimK-type ligase-like ATP-grasp enzyme
MSRVAFVTCAQLRNLSADDRLALDVLSARGHDVSAVVWNETATPWQSFDLVVLRSCWDYHRRPREFVHWLDQLEGQHVRLQNSIAIARWNMEKTYLRDLQEADVPVVPTYWLEPGTFQSLDALRRETGWSDIVFKPAISATAWRLWRARSEDAEVTDAARHAFDEHLFLAQPFMREIEQGEWSLVLFDGQFSHAVLKQARPGDFRVQNDFGGRSKAVVAPAGYLESAARILATLPECPLYARVDGVATLQGFVLLELELLEPTLFLAEHAEAARSFADAIERRL